jgi:hypothetical protein
MPLAHRYYLLGVECHSTPNDGKPNKKLDEVLC